MPEVSVVICTHNPQSAYLTRVLDALKAQTLPIQKWEILIVDNASKNQVSSQWDLSWHPGGRHIREDELGLVPARLRAMAESNGDLIVFVDDDNVLQSDYLQQAWNIAMQWPILGAWGGNIVGEFESEVEPRLIPYVDHLGLRRVEKPAWSNQSAFSNHAIPKGAGICVRKAVAEKYRYIVSSDKRRKSLDRVGNSLASSGDADLALTSCDLGYGTGLFPELQMVHLIPRRRIQYHYLLKLEEEIAFGHSLLSFLRGAPLQPISTVERVLAWYAAIRNTGMKRQMIRAHWRARLRYVKAIQGPAASAGS